MKNILCISTGGTFNKKYNPLNGDLEIDSKSKALADISKKWQSSFETVSIIGKDSLEMTGSDRLLLLATINLSTHRYIIVIHGTDTINVTASYLDDSDLDKCVVLVGSMMPYSIDAVEAAVNFGVAYGFLQAQKKPGIFIAMNGIIAEHQRIKKDKKRGKFILKESG